MVVGTILLLLFAGAASAQVSDPVLVGAGDISTCSNDNDEATARLLDGISGTIFALGDNAYEDGTDAEFADCYDPTWGRHKARTRPAPGNHEYNTVEASGYFNYFGAAAADASKGYYSYDLGEWHIVALNSMCDKVGGCGANSPMVTWLKNDLAANASTKCTLAYFHHPLFSSGEHDNQAKVKPVWNALYAANAEVVVNGHDHDYERFAPQNPDGVADPNQGIREFVVGTGGIELRRFAAVKPNSEVRNASAYGVLKLTLHPDSYDWEFVPAGGKTFTDSGSSQCHDADTAPPTVSSVTPQEGATGVAAAANVEATFSEVMSAKTLTNSTFTLLKQGTTTPVAAEVTYNAATRKAILAPNVALDAQATYTVTVRGGNNGVKDLAGNPLKADKVWSFTTAAPPLDTTPPETTMDSGPSRTVRDGSAAFSFSSSESDATFECSLGDSPFEICTSPKEYAGLADGPHTFKVRAIDTAGNVDTTPASRTWTVDTTKPVVTWVSPAQGSRTRDRTPTIRATVRDAQTNLAKANIRLFIDGRRITTFGYDTLKDRLMYRPRSKLASGKRTVKIIARDTAGNSVTTIRRFQILR
jgi:hypothetical protein